MQGVLGAQEFLRRTLSEWFVYEQAATSSRAPDGLILKYRDKCLIKLIGSHFKLSLFGALFSVT